MAALATEGLGCSDELRGSSGAEAQRSTPRNGTAEAMPLQGITRQLDLCPCGTPARQRINILRGRGCCVPGGRTQCARLGKLFDNQAVSLHLRSTIPGLRSIGLKEDKTDKSDNHAVMLIMLIMIITSDYHDYLDYHMRTSDKYFWFNRLPVNIAHRADQNDEWRGEGTADVLHGSAATDGRS